MKTICALYFCVCLLVSASAAFGQTFPISPAFMPETDKRLPGIENKALSLLEATVDESQSFNLPENRIYVLFSAADLLWARDEKRARQLFARAANEFTNEFVAVSGKSADGAADESEVIQNFSVLQAIRNKFLDLVASHDAELAIEFVRQTRPPILNRALNLPPNSAQYRYFYPLLQTEIALEKSFAKLMLRQNPRRALEIARENLRRGASSNDLSLINELKTTDIEAASQFAGEVLQKIAASDFSDEDNYEVRDVAAAFLTEFSTANAIITNSSDKPKQIQLNGAVLRRLAEKYADYFSGNVVQPDHYYEIQNVLPLLEKILPERAAAIRQKYAKLYPAKEKLEQLIKNAAPETMVAEAQNFPAQMRPQIYNSAANKAAQETNYEEARRLLSALPDKQNRERALLKLDQQTFKTDLDQGKYDEAEQIIQQQTESTPKIAFLVQIARHFYDKGQHDNALRYISQTYSMINPKPENIRELTDLIEVLSVSPEISPEKTFDLVESFIPKFNEILAANALPGNNQQCNCTFRRGEFVLSTINNGFYVNGGRTEGVYVGLYDLRLMFLARMDLERGMNLTARIDRRDVRLAARLLMLHGILFGGKTAVFLP